MIGTLAVDGWAVTFGTARRGIGGLRPRPVHFSLYHVYQLHIIRCGTINVSALYRVNGVLWVLQHPGLFLRGPQFVGSGKIVCMQCEIWDKFYSRNAYLEPN